MKNLLLLLLTIFFIGCDDKYGTNEVPIMHWDRDMCARCVMVISDRKNSIAIRGKTKKQEHRFDDIGCLIIWLKEENINPDNIDIWVNDLRSGEWIEAKTAYYMSGSITPMDYGFSAYKFKKDLPQDIKYFTFSDIYKKIKQ